MCEARRLRCDTLTLARASTIFTSNIPSTPRLQPLDLIQLLCVCEKEQDMSSQEHDGAIKLKSGTSGPSPKHLNNALPSHALIDMHY